ncbi:hypothetical protein [Mycobacteroides franklinii]|uniref:hypothetical protein n=1 Tax=Mycobacteroides franklinii TaxID=948102 RepID=UPI00104276FE|nr:hypothetical protein [Mycobacteroides franklinii]
MTDVAKRWARTAPALSICALTLVIAAGCGNAKEHEPSTAPNGSSGDSVLDGGYTLVVDGSQNLVNGVHRPNGVPTTTTWEVAPCGAGCSHVKSSMGWSTDLHLIDGTWQGTRTLTTDCSGTPAPASVEYTFDSKTLTGRAVNILRCEGQSPIVVDAPAALTKN